MNESTKALLASAVIADKETQRLIAMRQREFDRVTSITAQLGGSSSGTPDPHKFDALADLDLAIEQRLKETTSDRMKLYKLIMAIRDPRLEQVLYERYLCSTMGKDGSVRQKTWQQIAETMHYSQMHVQRLHRKAVDALEDVIACYDTGAI